MAILSVMGPDELAAAIAGQDATALTRVPGIGKKGASRIILELENKLPKFAAAAPGPALSFGGSNQQVVDALVGLGWKEPQAAEVVQEVVSDSVPTPAPRRCSKPPSRSWVRGNDRSDTVLTRY